MLTVCSIAFGEPALDSFASSSLNTSTASLFSLDFLKVTEEKEEMCFFSELHCLFFLSTQFRLKFRCFEIFFW